MRIFSLTHQRNPIQSDVESGDFCEQVSEKKPLISGKFQ